MASNPFMTLTIYSVGIFVVPITAFFATQRIVEMVSPTSDANVWSAVMAVIALHVILFAFVYKAFQEEKKVAAKVSEKKD